SLTLNRLKEAILEVKKVDGQIERHLKFIKEGVEKIIKEKEREIKEGKEEFNISKSELVKLVNRSLKQSIVGQMGYFDFVDRLLKIGTQLSEESTGESPVLKLGKFLEGWLKAGESSSRILSLKEPASISFNLLDPAIISTPVFSSVHASVVMSGTLYPPEMFKDILGISEAVCRAYPSPFPKENKKVIVTEGVTSKYKERRREMYQKIAENISNIANEIFENVAVFFPSYSFMMNVYEHYPQSPYWDIYLEKRGMSKKEKELLYKQLFKDIKTKRCMLWGVQAGSLSEGVDYEKNVLKAVIVVGLPLSPPSLDVKNLVAYYSKKFGKRKGHLYGYIYPALAKVIQSAGRGIRSEKDYGIIVLMDYRFKYPTYRKYFPDDFHIVVTDDPVRECREFFKRFKDRGRGN
ncbi:MAG TPA: hypothetical protein EYP29_04700, partial [Thermoplasmata archaeon]|nr:hypothetical protein [Thermoplasmata archaeon]